MNFFDSDRRALPEPRFAGRAARYTRPHKKSVFPEKSGHMPAPADFAAYRRYGCESRKTEFFHSVLAEIFAYYSAGVLICTSSWLNGISMPTLSNAFFMLSFKSK